jgi:DNA-directed RNA polymerase specialized sigma24 family protein
MGPRGCAPESMVTVRRQNLAADLASDDVSVREAALERVPTFIREGVTVAGSVLYQWDDAEDVVSDSLHHWLKVPSRFNDAHTIPDLAWFKITVRHRALTVLKTRVRQGRMNQQLATLTDGEDVFPEMLELLYEAIARLPMAHQRVLRTYLNWKAAPSPERAGVRLGAELGVPPRKAKQMFAAAKSALRLEIQTLMAHGSHTGGSS